ncbi:hypothetical protein KP509_03G029700 [Ceratopteris richardii]|nr:hypothetical protein KP509_03G029700 [Ceratopteris richardii]
MYAKAGSLTDAYKLFNDLPCRDMLSWGALLGGYVKQGESGHALELFQVMLLEGIKLNKVIALCMLKACGVSEALLQGRLLHLEVIELNVLTDPVIISALIDMYAKCGSLSDACNVLESSTTRCMVSWGALFGGLIDQGEYSTAFKMFERMSQDGIKPNEFIFSCLASACGKLKNLQRANFLHDQIIKNGVETDTVLGNTLVGMYTDCGSLLMARKVFNTLDSRSLVSWSTMISGYTQNGSALDAVKLFELMQHEGIKPNMVIYSSVLKACSILGAIGLGKLVHHFMIKNDEELDVVVGTTLIELYASCHSLCEACNVFYQIPNRNTVCWGVMVTSMAQHGMFELAKQYLDRMHQQGFKADAKVFTNILAACNQKGRSEEGQQFFELMMDVHDIVPSPEHIHCIVDLLGRKGLLMRAMKLLQSIHNTKDLCGWISLLSACRLHGNVALGRQCFKHIISLDYHVGAAYMLMSCIYAEAHMWDDYYELMEVMKKDMVREELVQ